MKKFTLSKIYIPGLTILITLLVFLPGWSWSQTTKLKINDFVVFGGNSNFTGCGVLINSSVKIYSGKVGSYSLIRTTGNAYLGGNLHSGGIIELKNSNVIKGKITSGNSQNLNRTILEAGSNTSIFGNVDVKGNIRIKSGYVKGKVTHPEGTLYTGPAPTGGELTGVPLLPKMPDLPQIVNFPAAVDSIFSNSKVITPGVYGKIALTGNKTITFSGPGIYVFSTVKNSGATNNFVFDFKNNLSGVFRIYVHGDVDLNKVSTSLINGGSATRIFTETHGNGYSSASKTEAFVIANGSSGNSSSRWSGTVWAPYGGISIGSCGGKDDIVGALYSGKGVTLHSGVNIKFAAFKECVKPDVDAGPNKQLDCSNTSALLAGSSFTSNVQYSWKAINGGIISSGANTNTPTVTAGGDYILKVTTPVGNCTASDTVHVTFTPCILPDYPPPPGGKINNIIGAELNSLFLNFDTSDTLSGNVFQIRTDSVYIEVISRVGQYANLLALLQTSNYGISDLINNGTGSLIITGKYPIENLKKLDSLPDLIDYCRPLFPPLGNSGITTTQGDISIGGNFIRNGYNLSGEGVKVGVLSDSYNTLSGNRAQIDVANGDLPGTENPNYLNPVQVLKDYPYGRRTDEGRAMLQIIHDIAPQAGLAFRTGFISPGDFAQGIKELQQASCDIIVDDITFITEPFFQDGVVATAVDQVTSQGVAYFSAAGNYGNKSYENTFNPIAAPAGITGLAHNFGGGDIFQNISLKPGSYTIVLQWEDAIYSLGQTQTGTINDLDIFLTDNNGVALFGFNRNNIGADPLEILPFNVTLNTNTNILITRPSGTGNVRFKYIIFRGEAIINEFNVGNSTIVGQANATGAIAVGAVLYTNTPAFGNVPSMASFSSIGGTPVNGQVRSKPDFAAPNGVNTTVDLTGGNTDLNIDNDIFPNFFGTSAAAPHAAGAAALLIQAKKKFSNLDIPPTDLRDLMRSSAINIENSGFDFFSGFGFIQPDAALRTFASPKPELVELVLPLPNFQPGTAAFVLKLTGNFLDQTAVVTFRGKPVASTFVNKSELTASIPAFTGNPPIQVFTQSISTSGNDGGFSDTLYFFAPVKRKITVKADDKTKKFGESIPDFTVSILVDDVPLANTELTPADLGLENILYASPANNLSNTANYFIRPSITPLDSEDPNDIALLEKFTYTFLDGILSIQKLQLTITPKDTVLTYGDRINEFKFKYEYDSSRFENTNASIFVNNLNIAYQENLAEAIALVDARALVNGRALVNADLESLSFLVSARALVNARQLVNARALVNNVTVFDTTQIVDVAVGSVFNYQVDSAVAVLVSARQLVNARALVNAKALVNGTASVNARQLVNGSPIVNSNTVDNTAGQVVVIIDEDDVDASSNDVLNEFKSITLVTGITAGVFAIVPGALLSDNFEITYGLGKLTILPANLNVKADDKFIYRGASLPAFTSTISGYKNGDVIPIASGPKYSISPQYCSLAGVYSIQPSKLVFCDSNPNYKIKYIPGNLYVNPKGWGAKKIIPSLDCIKILTNHPSGYQYVAQFSYQNNNTKPVYVPVGNDNMILTGGGYSGIQPIVFMPGGGKFDIYFNGSQLTWTVKTYDCNTKISVSAIASSNSYQCEVSNVLASNMQMSVGNPVGKGQDFDLKSNLQDEALKNNLSIFPNPVSDMVTIQWKNISDKGISITDVSGRAYLVNGIRKLSENSLELDLSGLKTGLYLIRVMGETDYKVLRIIKM